MQKLMRVVEVEWLKFISVANFIPSLFPVIYLERRKSAITSRRSQSAEFEEDADVGEDGWALEVKSGAAGFGVQNRTETTCVKTQNC